MAQRKLRIIQPNKPDTFVPNVKQNIDSFAEIIKNTRQQMRVELVDLNEDYTFKTISVIMESNQFESESKKTNVIQNLADENAELKRQLELLQSAKENEVEKPKGSGRWPKKPNTMKEGVEQA